VQKLDCDFLVFSGHKLYGPTGIGVLYGKKELLEKMSPFKTGGGMIKKVSFEKTEFADLPFKFEAGTPPIAEAIGLGEAIRYFKQFDFEALYQLETHLLQYAEEKMRSINGLRIIGAAPHKSSIISFIMNRAHPHDIATILDSEGIAIRAGHHCTMPLMQRFDIPATARVSFALYNTESEVDCLIAALHKVKDIFQ
jgi:cysteine desulfurase/selenocysteine lyase